MKNGPRYINQRESDNILINVARLDLCFSYLKRENPVALLILATLLGHSTFR